MVPDVSDFLAFFVPLFETVDERRAFLRRALGLQSPLFALIQWEGDAQTFTINLFSLLAQREREELHALIAVVMEEYGVEQQARLIALLPSVYPWIESNVQRKALRAAELPLLPNLIMPKADVEAKLRKQIEVGQALAGRRIRTVSGFNPAKVAQEHWNAYNVELLARCFDSPVYAKQYQELAITPNATYQRASRGKNIMRAEIERCLRLLKSILNRLELLPDVEESK
jgi:hypothetical protein